MHPSVIHRDALALIIIIIIITTLTVKTCCSQRSQRCVVILGGNEFGKIKDVQHIFFIKKIIKKPSRFVLFTKLFVVP
jgi:hypothetical protein